MFVRLGCNAVAEGDGFAGIGGNTLAGNDDADKIQGICGGDLDGFAGGWLLARGAQGLRKRAGK